MAPLPHRDFALVVITLDKAQIDNNPKPLLDNLNKLNKKQSKKTIMADKPKTEIKVERTNTTYSWYWAVVWYDEDGNEIGFCYGYENSKREARKEAKEASKGDPCYPEQKKRAVKADPTVSVKIHILPPHIDAKVINGHLAYFSIENPQGKRVVFSTHDISENTAFWVFGMDCFDPELSTKAELVAAMLKIWGVYVHGEESEKELKRIHQLSDEHFAIIAEKRWNQITIECYEDGSFNWSFAD